MSSPSPSTTTNDFDPSRHTNQQINLISTLFEQKRQRDKREQRKLESEIYCRPQIHFFAMCMTGRTITAPFACRSLHRSMLHCLHEYLDKPALDIHKVNFGRDEVFGGDVTRSASYVTPEELQRFNESVADMEAKHGVST